MRRKKENECLLLKVQQHMEDAEVWHSFSASVFTRESVLQETQGVNMEHGNYSLGGRGSLQAVLRESGQGALMVCTQVLRELADIIMKPFLLIFEYS